MSQSHPQSGLEIYDYQEISEAVAVGETVARVEYGFDSDTGALICQRTLESGSTRGADDVLVTHDLDTLGRVTDVKTYGGDLQTLSTSGADCGDVPAQPEYWMTHTYDTWSGARVSTQAREPDGTYGLFLSYNVDVDPSTGLVTASRDATGLTTVYDYDALGRLTSVTPPGRANQEYTYIGATPTAQAKIVQQSVSGTTVLTDSETLFDDFGRAWKERVKMPGGTWSERETLYNARGWTESVSALGDTEERTEYLDYDPFGRPGTVTPPEGSAHDVRFTYVGMRKVTEESRIALPTGEAYVPRVKESDRYGRLRKVVEDSDAGAALTTAYDYDVGGQLTAITSGPTSGSVTQQRLFSYDNRGFLLQETHPEKGTSGNGSVFYGDYNSLGQIGSRLDGPNQVSYSYDHLGRLLNVNDKNNGGRYLINNVYDTAAGNAVGKLRLSRRNTWVDLPWNAGGEEWVAVSRLFVYDDTSGDIKTTLTYVDFQGEENKWFVQRYEYDDLGNVTQIEYPFCDHASCAATVSAGPTVEMTFDQGRLEEITGWTNTITYHANGSLATIPHGNGVTDYRLVDSANTARPAQFYTTGVTQNQNWDSGAFSYDGGRNITAMGSNSFTYDEVQRLVSGSVAGWSQDYTYDAFGNVTTKTTTDPSSQTTVVTFGVDEETNRLSAATYDAAGNMTHWGATSYGYGALGSMVTLDSRWIYLYDSGGERVATIDWTGSIASRAITYTVRGLGNEVLSSFIQLGEDAAGNWSRGRDRVYAVGRLLGYEESGVRTHYHLDHLGTPRRLTDGNATTVSAHDYLPYGEEVSSPGDDAMKFTGHERDLATGLDYMHARYYNAELCRLLRVDPVRGRASDPQSLNRYAYALGNPMKFTDPDGESPQDSTETSQDPCHDCPTEEEDLPWYIKVLRDLAQDAIEQEIRKRNPRLRNRVCGGLLQNLVRYDPGSSWNPRHPRTVANLAGQASLLLDPRYMGQMRAMGERLMDLAAKKEQPWEFGAWGTMNSRGDLQWTPPIEGVRVPGPIPRFTFPERPANPTFLLHNHPEADDGGTYFPGPDDYVLTRRLGIPVFVVTSKGISMVPVLADRRSADPIDGYFSWSNDHLDQLQAYRDECVGGGF